MHKTSKKSYFLDLFAGSGGFSLGLESAGFTWLGAVEIDARAKETLQANFGQSRLRCIQEACGDVRKLPISRLKRELAQKNITLDLLVACPPCQGFAGVGRAKLDSLAGRRKAYRSDPRNKLYKYFIDILHAIKPRAFLFENVPGMMTMCGQNFAEAVCEEAAAAGYSVRAALLNAAWYGVPQFRERVIIIGFQQELEIIPKFPLIRRNGFKGVHMSTSDAILSRWKDKRFFVPYSRLPRKKHTPSPVAVGEALADLPEFTAHLDALQEGRGYKALRSCHKPTPYRSSQPPNQYCRLMRSWTRFQSSIVTDHFCRWTPRDFQIFRKMKPGDKYPDALKIAGRIFAAKLQRARKNGGPTPSKSEVIPPYPRDSFKDKWRKLDPDMFSWTLTAHLAKDVYSHIHYDSLQARGISVREAARLQSFPDAFCFAGNTGDALRQIGNAVPPLMAEAIGRVIRKQLECKQRRKRH